MIVQSSPAESVGSIDRVGIRAWLTAVGLEKYADAVVSG